MLTEFSQHSWKGSSSWAELDWSTDCGRRNNCQATANSTELHNCWTETQRPWEPYSYRASSTVEHSILRQFPRGSRGDRGDGRDRGAVCCLTLNDIQNSLQLILFRMHKYKQMGMPRKRGHNPGPLTSFSCPDSRLPTPTPTSTPARSPTCYDIRDEASASYTRNNNLTNWPILA